MSSYDHGLPLGPTQTIQTSNKMKRNDKGKQNDIVHNCVFYWQLFETSAVLAALRDEVVEVHAPH